MSGMLVLMNARLLDRDGAVDIGVEDGVITSISASGDDLPARLASAERIDAGGNLVVPPFADPHFHLDKVFTRSAFGAVTPQEAFDHARDVKTAFTVDDVVERASRALDLAAAHGIGAVRAQCDVDSFTGLVSLEGLLATRDAYAGVVDLQLVAFPQEGIVSDPQSKGLLREAMAMGADLVGGLPEIERGTDHQKEHLEEIFAIADEFTVNIDMHIDYVDDPSLHTLELLASLTTARGYQGRVTADHCNALATYPDDYAKRVIEQVAAAQIGVTVMPMANLQMLGGEGRRTPTTRGSSRMAELLDEGVCVASGSDNMVDIWYAFNRMDPAELGLITCLSGGLRTDAEVRLGFDMTNKLAAEVMGLPERNIALGEPADLVVLNGSTVSEFFRNVPGPRTMIRRGIRVASITGGTWQR